MLYREKLNQPQKIITDYRIILNRLWKTLAEYAVEYPEIAAIKQEIAHIKFNILLLDAHQNHLLKICKLLDDNKDKALMINKLHVEFCSDLELFKRGASIPQKDETYLV